MITRAVLFEEFAGRAEELAFLVEFRTRSGREARGGAVIVSGDSGVGKTRLLSEFHHAIERERGGIAVVRCDEARSRPYGPLIEALEKLSNARDLRGAPAIGAALEALTRGSAVVVEDAAEQRLQRLAALRVALEDASRRLGHLTLVVDDLHTSDFATLEALRGLAVAAKRLPFALVLAYRSDDIESDMPRSTALSAIEREGADRILLRGLPRQTLSHSLRTLLPAASNATIARILDLSEGKPYVAEELARSIVERGGGSEIQTTLSLRTAVLGRSNALDATSRDIVRRAAVLGNVVRVDDLLASGAAHDDIVRALRSARDLQLIEERQIDGEAAFRFRHALTKEILYADLLAVERHAIHLEAADRLQREEPHRLAEIAYHLDASGSTVRAREASEKAGDRAIDVAAFADAVALYVRAAEGFRTSDPHDLARVAGKFLVALDGAGGLDERAAFFESICDRLERAGLLVEAFTLRVRALKIYATYESPRTAPMVPRVRKAAPHGTPDDVRFEAAIAIFHALVLAYRFEDAVEVLEDAQAVAPDPTPLQLGKILIAKTMLAFHFYGDPIAAEALIRTTRELARESGSNDRRVANATKNLSAIAAERGDFHEARTFANEASAAFAKAGFHRWAEKCDGIAAMYSAQLGDFTTATKLLAATSDESLREREWIVARALVTRAIGGDRAELEDALREGIARHDTIFVRHLAAELAWSSHTAENAQAVIRDALRAAPGFDTDMDMADAVVAFGEPDDVARAANHVRALDISEAHVLAHAGRHLIEARLAARENRTIAATESARAAEVLYERMGLWAQRSQALRIAGRIDEARALLRDIGATAELARFTDESRKAKAPAVLSQREEQVARLAAKGHVAREIAESLSISPRTVETHLGNVYEKLRLRSRAELALYFSEN